MLHKRVPIRNHRPSPVKGWIGERECFTVRGLGALLRVTFCCEYSPGRGSLRFLVFRVIEAERNRDSRAALLRLLRLLQRRSRGCAIVRVHRSGLQSAQIRDRRCAHTREEVAPVVIVLAPAVLEHRVGDELLAPCQGHGHGTDRIRGEIRNIILAS